MKARTGMGTWKSKIIRKQGKASRTKSSRSRLYTIVPPEGGWKGGLPEANGLRGGRK